MPHYCWLGNCRVCLIELEQAPKALISCSMGTELILNVNKIYFESPLIKKSHQIVIEFLLLNHPLDCPIGVIVTYRTSLFFWFFTKRRFYKFKHIVNDKKLGPLIKTVITRCIHCTHCLRFCLLSRPNQ